MHIDESLPTFLPPTGGSRPEPDIQRPAPVVAKGTAMPGGVPPMFASPVARFPGPRADTLEH